jgi:DNA-binding beta-propeller fold protein YncE
VEVPEPANSAIIDSTRGVAYVANGLGTVDIFSLAQQTFVGSIPVPWKPQVVTLSSDGTTLYAGLFDVGSVVTIDRNTNSVTNSVNLTSALGTADILSIAEISPGHILVSSIPSEGGVGPNTYLVDVVLSNPSTAHRVGCASGYQESFLSSVRMVIISTPLGHPRVPLQKSAISPSWVIPLSYLDL